MTSPSRTERDPPLPPVVRVRRSEALEEALRRRRPRDMAEERAFPSSARLGPGKGLSGPVGVREETPSEAWMLGCVLPGPVWIPVALGSCWHPEHAELWGHAVQPPGAPPTTGHWHR